MAPYATQLLAILAPTSSKWRRKVRHIGNGRGPHRPASGHALIFTTPNAAAVFHSSLPLRITIRSPMNLGLASNLPFHYSRHVCRVTDRTHACSIGHSLTTRLRGQSLIWRRVMRRPQGGVVMSHTFDVERFLAADWHLSRRSHFR